MTLSLRIMSASLSPRERRTAKRVAKDIIGSPAPLWAHVGEDQKDRMFDQFMQRLRDTQNSKIAIVLEKDRETAFTMFQEKSKSMRAEEKRSGKKGSQRKRRYASKHKGWEGECWSWVRGGRRRRKSRAGGGIA
ncbi:hypothetical protein PVAG01_05982 [Phlyctema vagabunda]|uniref:Uncharacterized protein n=1 Tax=Phlyctema vagabunda TaxID=108571 RepID=A0ABR4PES5_9HELO